MQVAHHNNVKIYSITSASQSAIPDWLARQKSKALKKDSKWTQRIELLQDFTFPEASIKLKATRDGQYLMATGIYKPSIKVYDLSQLSMKFDRRMDAENVDFCLLSDDWTKSVHLQNDRTIEFHSQFGLHYTTRIPKVGRSIAYDFNTADVLVGGSSSDIYRLNLEMGRFMKSLETDMTQVNTTVVNPAHGLYAFGGDGLEFWHPFSKTKIAQLDVMKHLYAKVDSSLLESSPLVTSLNFAQDGLHFAVGFSTGQILTYDLRSSTPLLFKDHQYGFPIHSLHYHGSGQLLSADTKVVKIWHQETGKAFTSIEAPTDINDLCVYQDSGLVMMANEGIEMQSFYIPMLGPAPKWCPFLDNLTEELEENPTALYDDYKFLTRKELSDLGLDHLIGTNTLKAYMHGFFVDMRLYEKARVIANPFQIQEHKKKLVQDKMALEQRIVIPKVKANKRLVEKLSSKKKEQEILKDDRFSALFQDTDFQVDEESHEFRLRNPSTKLDKIPDAMGFYSLKEGLDLNEDEDDFEDRILDQVRINEAKKMGNQTMTF